MAPSRAQAGCFQQLCALNILTFTHFAPSVEMIESASASIGSLVAAAVSDAESSMPKCQVRGKQLTWECGGLCDDYVPCVVLNATSTCEECVEDDADKCQYWCLPQAYDNESKFELLIPFGAKERENVFVVAYEAEASKGATAFPSADNLTLVSAMQLHPNCTSV